MCINKEDTLLKPLGLNPASQKPIWRCVQKKRLEKRQKHSYVIQLQVRETESLNKTGVLKHVKDIILKIRKITDRLAKVNNLPGQNPGS
jgi:hypothetical protein